LPKTTRQNEIDLLRIIAALTVFFYHYTDSFNYANRIVPGNIFIIPLSRYGYMGVPLFFVISGYVVTMTAMDKSITGFLKSRVIRLYPAFWVSCLITFLLPHLFPALPAYLPYPGIKQVLVNCTMIPSLFGVKMINPVYWSLLEEMHFYLLIAAIIFFKLWNKIILVIICWLAIYITVGLLGYARPDDGVGVIVPKHSLYFIAGILFYLVRIKYVTQWKLTALLSFIFVLLIGMSYVFTQNTNHFYKPTNAVSIYGFIFINLAIYCIFWLIATKKLLITQNKTLKFFGDLTYPFYLTHILGLGLYWYLRNTVQSQVLLVMMLFICITTAFLINQFFEKPVSRLFKRK
jgi:peptidoglycan/LPS O-acetylase OafA/YrhL